MRIGVYLSGASPEEGGGYTFEAAVVEELMRGNEGRDFLFLGPRGATMTALAVAGAPVLHTDVPSIKNVTTKIRRAASALSSPIGRVTAPTYADRLIGRAPIDFLWCLGFQVPTMEIPFSMTVWDLQHRLQPFFPEVSAHGAWAGREWYFSTHLRRAAIVVSGTRAGSDEIARFYGITDDRIVIAPHPTPTFPEPTHSDEAILARYGLAPGYLVYPAQFWAHKNHVGLLHAAARLDPVPEIVLTGSDRDGIQDYVRSVAALLGIAERVKLLGFVERSELPALYRNAWALVYPSFFGPENLPPLEAFSLGCPVVAADVPGAPEQLGDAALLVDPKSPDDIASALRKVLDPEARRGLIDRGHARAATRTPAGFVDAVLAAIERFDPLRATWPSPAR